MGKKRLKRNDWLHAMLGIVVLAPIALIVGFIVYSRLHPQGTEEGLGQEEPAEPPEFVTTAEGAMDRIDSVLELESLGASYPAFKRWRGTRTLVFYFSAGCSRCKKAFPLLQDLADTLKSEGIETIALAISGNSHDGILEFSRAQHCRLALYHDEGKRFGERYGARKVPLAVLVDTNGAYMQFHGFKASTPARIRSGLEMMSASHHAIGPVGG